jgi:hypothetical protein
MTPMFSRTPPPVPSGRIKLYHRFRATGITIYRTYGGDLEKAQQMAAHESPRTTKLYDRRSDAVSLDEVERWYSKLPEVIRARHCQNGDAVSSGRGNCEDAGAIKRAAAAALSLDQPKKPGLRGSDAPALLCDLS